MHTTIDQLAHTPGPWTVARFDDEDADCIVGPAGDERICEMRGNECTPENARLIAAAPELLRIVEVLDRWPHSWRHDAMLPLFEQARAALARATKGV